MRNTYLASAIGAITLAAQVPAVSFAQSEGSELVLEEVIVTATKRTMSLQSVAESITAYSQHDLENAGIQDFASLTESIAGVELRNTQPGAGAVAIRGVSELNIANMQGGTGSAVGFYLDEMPLTMAAKFPDMKSFDMERIEVLKGPQGALYGEGSMAGTVRMISNKPDTEEFSAAIDATYSDTEDGDDNQMANLMVNFPLIEDQLALRVVGSWSDMSGYIDNVGYSDGVLRDEDANTVESTSLRFVLGWTPSEDLAITATAMFSELDIGAPSTGTEELYNATSVAEPTDDDLEGYNLKIEYSLPFADFVSSTSYFDRKAESVFDQGGLVDPLNGILGVFGIRPVDGVFMDQLVDVEAFSQEFRLVSHNDGPLNWTVGAFYKEQDFIFKFDGLGVPTTPAAVWELVSETFFGVTISEALSIGNDATTEQYAVFGELTYDFTDQLQLIAGGRYFDEDRDSELAWGGVVPVLLGGPFPGSVTTEGDDNLFNPRVSLRYEISDDAMLYGTYSEGFRSGGQNDIFPLVPGSNVTYDSETLANYELGLKSEWFDRRLQVNGSLYYIQWDDLQAVVAEGPGGIGEVIDNIGDAHTAGLDLEIKALLTENLDFSLSGSVLESEIDDDVLVPDPSGGDPIEVPEGTRIPGVAESSVSMALQYHTELSAGIGGFARVSYSYVGDATNQLTRDAKTPSYDIVNLRLGVEGDNWQVTLFADNLTDGFVATRRKVTDDNLTGNARWNIGRPRTIGLNVRYSL